MKPLLIVKVGSTHPHIAQALGDFEHWIVEGLGTPAQPISVVDPREGHALPAIAEVAGAIVTGSHSMVTDQEPWSEQTAAWLRTMVAADVPVLGICYGHQLLAHALGGEVAYHPGGIELGTVPIHLTPAAKEDPLFGGLPSPFGGQAAHRQSVRCLPQGAVHLAGNDFEPHHAYRVGTSAWGVQFHPEFDERAIAAYVDANTDLLPRPQVLPAPEAASLLRQFAHIVSQVT
jgi:GMP synthase (glutamine-hydrolysing)